MSRKIFEIIVRRVPLAAVGGRPPPVGAAPAPPGLARVDALPGSHRGRLAPPRHHPGCPGGYNVFPRGVPGRDVVQYLVGPAPPRTWPAARGRGRTAVNGHLFIAPGDITQLSADAIA